MTLEDIPERLRLPGLIINNGQRVTVLLSEETCDRLAFIVLDDKKESA